MWFIGVEVERETIAPAPKKNPGSAPELLTGYFDLLQGNWIIKRFNMNRAGVTQVRSLSIRVCTEKLYF